MRQVVKWEGIWVILVEVAAYGANLVSPDADFVSFTLENGSLIEWSDCGSFKPPTLGCACCVLEPFLFSPIGSALRRLDPYLPGFADDFGQHDHRRWHEAARRASRAPSGELSRIIRRQPARRGSDALRGRLGALQLAHLGPNPCVLSAHQVANLTMIILGVTSAVASLFKVVPLMYPYSSS